MKSMWNKRILVYTIQAVIVLMLVVGFCMAEIQNVFAAGYIAEGKCGTCNWTIDTNGTLTISAGNLDNWRTGIPPWCDSRYINEIKSVKTDGKVVLATGQNMFIDCINLTEADLSGLDTSRVRSMNSMFSNCKALKELDLSNFDVSGIGGGASDMQYMLKNCTALKKLTIGKWSSVDILPTFPVNMYDSTDNRLYTAGEMIPSADNRTFSTTKSDLTAPTGSIESTNNVGNAQTVTLIMQDNGEVDGYYWGTDSDVTGNSYTDIGNSSSTSATVLVTDSGTYYFAVVDTNGNLSETYSAVFYKTTLDANGGKVEHSYSITDTMTVITLSGQSFNIPEAERDGYTCMGWSTSKSAESGIKTLKPEGDQTYYAAWKKNPFGRVNEFSFGNSKKDFNTGKYTLTDSDYNKLCDYLKKMGSTYYKDSVTSEKNSSWSGSCYGMSLATILDYNNQIGFNENFDPGKKTMHDVSSPKSNKNVMSAINYYHLSQNIIPLRSNERIYPAGSLTYGLKSLVTRAQSGQIMMLSYFYKEDGDTCGHAIVIKGYGGQESNGNHKLIAYDCRYPDKDTIVNVSGDYSSCVVNGSKKEYPHQIGITWDFTLYDKIDIDGPNNDMVIGGSANLLAGTAGTEIFVPSNEDVRIENEDGETLRVSDGMVTDSTMDVIEEHMIVYSTEDGEDVPGILAITVEDGDSFSLSTESGNIDASVIDDSFYSKVTAENADSVTMSKDETALTGSKVDYTVTQAVDSDLCDMFSCSGTIDGNGAVSFSDDEITITGHDGGDVSVKQYISGTEEEFIVNSLLEELLIMISNYGKEDSCTYGHLLEHIDAVDASCEKDGNIAYWYCDKCKRVYDDSKMISMEDTVVKAPGHDWGEWTVETPPTRYAAGLESRVCRRDESHKETRELPALTDPFEISLNVDNTGHGTASITVNNSSNSKTAYAGDTVTVKAKPKGSYSPSVIVTSAADGSLVEKLDLTAEAGTFIGTFTMPGYPVTVSVKFEGSGEGSDSDSDSKTNRKGDRHVDTGDESYMGLWLTIAILAALEFAVFAIMRKRRSRN